VSVRVSAPPCASQCPCSSERWRCGRGALTLLMLALILAAAAREVNADALGLLLWLRLQLLLPREVDHSCIG